MSGVGGRILRTDQIGGVTGPVVVIDVIRAFTTAAAALSAGARCAYLVGTVEEALAFKASHHNVIAVGEDYGLMPVGFDLPNSPVLAEGADLEGRTVVQRTSAGTQGVVAARAASRLWCASLVCASATARAVVEASLGEPTFVATGWFLDQPGRPGRDGEDDILTAKFIDALCRGGPVNAAQVAADVAATDEASRTLALGVGHVHPEDIDLAVDVDRYDFAMEVTRDELGLRLGRVDPI